MSINDAKNKLIIQLPDNSHRLIPIPLIFPIMHLSLRSVPERFPPDSPCSVGHVIFLQVDVSTAQLRVQGTEFQLSMVVLGHKTSLKGCKGSNKLLIFFPHQLRNFIINRSTYYNIKLSFYIDAMLYIHPHLSFFLLTSHNNYYTIFNTTNFFI